MFGGEAGSINRVILRFIRRRGRGASVRRGLGRGDSGRPCPSRRAPSSPSWRDSGTGSERRGLDDRAPPPRRRRRSSPSASRSERACVVRLARLSRRRRSSRRREPELPPGPASAISGACCVVDHDGGLVAALDQALFAQVGAAVGHERESPPVGPTKFTRSAMFAAKECSARSSGPGRRTSRRAGSPPPVERPLSPGPDTARKPIVAAVAGRETARIPSNARRCHRRA